MFEPGRVFALATMLAVCGVTLWSIRAALRGKQIRIRNMPGMRVIEEMVGRTTEMGRPVHVSTGVGSPSADAPPVACSIWLTVRLLSTLPRDHLQARPGLKPTPDFRLIDLAGNLLLIRAHDHGK